MTKAKDLKSTKSSGTGILTGGGETGDLSFLLIIVLGNKEDTGTLLHIISAIPISLRNRFCFVASFPITRKTLHIFRNQDEPATSFSPYIVETETVLKPGTIYFQASDKGMFLCGNEFQTYNISADTGGRCGSLIFADSLAPARQPVATIVLSEIKSLTDHLQAIKARGSVIIFDDQGNGDGHTQKFGQTSLSYADYVLPSEKIGERIVEIMKRDPGIFSDGLREKKGLPASVELELVMNNTRECFILIDHDLRIVTFNKQFREFYGRFFGKEVYKGENILDYSKPERREMLAGVYRKVFEGNEINLDFEVQMPDGETCYFLNCYRPAVNSANEIVGVIVTSFDNNQYKKKELDLIKSEIRFRSLFENSSDGILLVSAEGKIIEISPSGKKILGSRDFTSGVLLEPDLVHPEDLQNVCDLFTESLKYRGRIFKGEYRVRTHEHNYSWLEFSFNNQINDPAIGAIVANFRDISKRREAEEQLQKSNRHLATAQQIAQLGYWEIDFVNKTRYWSEEMLSFFDIEKFAETPDVNAFLQYVVEHDRARISGLLDESYRTGKKIQVEFRAVRKDGPIRDILGRFGFTLDDKGNPLRLEGTIQDITETNLIKKALVDSETKYKYLFNHSPLPLWIYDLETKRYLEVNNAAVEAYGYSRDELLSKTILEIRPESDREGWLLKLKGLNENSGSFHSLSRIYKKNGELVDVDITSHLIDYEGRKAVLVLSNDITEKLKAENALRKANKRLENAQQIANLGYWEFDIKNDVLFWSDELFQIFQIDKSDFGANFNAFVETVHPDDIPSVYEQRKKLESQGHFRYERRTILKDGSIKTILEIGSYVYDESGTPIRIEGTAQDITLRKQQEQAVRDSEVKYRTIVNSSPIPIWIHEVETSRIFEVNEAAINHYGYGREDFLSMTTVELWDREDTDSFNAMKTSDHSKPFNAVVKHRKKNGEIILVQLQSIVVNFDGRDARLIQVLDITEKVKNETELIRANKKLNAAQEIGQLGYWETSLDRKEMFWSDAVYKIFGLDKRTFRLTYPNYYAMIHPDDRDEYTRGREAAYINRKEFHIEHRIICSDGSIKYVYQKGGMVMDEEGKPLRYEGIIQDITRRKTEEHHLKLLESVITHATDSVLITEASPLDEPGPRILYVNEAFTTMTGYSKEEVIGRSPRFLQGPKTEKVELARLKKAIRHYKSIEIEIINYKKSGEEFWVNMVIAPISDQTGVPTHFIAIQRDVTERKKRNQEITKAIFIAQEKERHELGSELHDNVNQILATAQLTLSMAKNATPESAESWINRTSDYLVMAADEIRRLSHRLAPPSFEQNSMQDAFELLLKNINVENRFEIHTRFDRFLKAHNLNSELQLNLYRILQEQLKNIIKYADATRIEVEVLLPDIHTIRMRISDNGKGFNPDQVKRGIGLNNIRKRAEFFHGEFTLNTAPGKGCEVVVEIPVV